MNGINYFGSRKTLLIIVTFNSYGLLPGMVDTVREFVTDHPGNHVIIVENSSDQRVESFIAAKLTSERIVVKVASVNEGFSPGVNYGYEIAQDLWGGFDFIVLLNPDVLTAGRTVSELVNRAAQNSEVGVGIWGAVLVNERGSIDAGCARRALNRRRYFSSFLLGYPNFAKLMFTSPLGLTEIEIRNNQSELKMISGALMCIRASVFGSGLDTRLPMYLEDQEICLRCSNQGYAVRVFPDLRSVHVGGLSTQSNSGDKPALQIMSGVEAPLLLMSLFQGYGRLWMRPAVFLGGASRFFSAPMLAAFRILIRKSIAREQYDWMAGQLRLGRSFILWALTRNLHNEEVSLKDYFQEYSTVKRQWFWPFSKRD